MRRAPVDRTRIDERTGRGAGSLLRAARKRRSRGRFVVDWIEQVFGIDPDFGSGALEILIAGAIVLIVVGVVLMRRRASRRDVTVR